MPPPNEPMFIFAFANREGDRYLESLQKEKEHLNNLAGKCKKIRYLADGNATLNDIVHNFNNHINTTTLFHFSGHSSPVFLELFNEIVHSKTIDNILGDEKNLKLVFLNGCQSRGLANNLLSKGVKLVISTKRKVEDEKAAIFSIQFYEAFFSGRTIQASFKQATSLWENQEYNSFWEKFRSFVFRGIGIEETGGCPYELKIADGYDDIKNQTISNWYNLGNFNNGLSDTFSKPDIEPVISLINRGEQDSNLLTLIDSVEKNKGIPVILYGNDKHDPNLYLKRLTHFTLKNKDNLPKKVHYKFPLKCSNSEEFNAQIRNHINPGNRNFYGQTKEEIIKNIDSKTIIFWSSISFDELVKRGKIILDLHRKYWSNYIIDHYLDKKIISILIIRNVKIDSQKELAAHTIIKEWENANSSKGSELDFSVLELNSINPTEIEDWFTISEKELKNVFSNAYTKFYYQILEKVKKHPTKFSYLKNIRKEIIKYHNKL